MIDTLDYLNAIAAGMPTRGFVTASSTYEQSSLGAYAGLVAMCAQDMDRAAERLVDENILVRALFADAAPHVADAGLRTRLETAAAYHEESLRVSALKGENDALRALLIELHAHVEELDTPEAARIDAAIWAELARSVERLDPPVM